MKKIKNIYILAFLFVLISCGEKFLDEKPNQRLRVPVTIEDCQAILDQKSTMNRFSSHLLGVLGADEIYIRDESWALFPVGADYYNFQKNAYFRRSVIYEGGELNTDWSYAYDRILRANIVLDALKKIDASDEGQVAFNDVKGTALFHRAWRYYQLAQLYCKPYDENTGLSDLGLPVRLESDPNANVPRSQLKTTYEQMLNDLQEALTLLPENAITVFRPSKSAVCALLSRIYLQMNDFVLAEHFAGESLANNQELLDFNTLNLEKSHPFEIYGKGNSEIVYMDLLATTELLDSYSGFLNMEPSLVDNYSEGDLRKSCYFIQDAVGNYLFQGSYGGDNSFLFSGFAVDEMYLIRAECLARLGKITEAMADLNTLLQHRFVPDLFRPLQIVDQEGLIITILAERKKELVFRGVRWEDLRRLNKEASYSTALIRDNASESAELVPGDARWVWPLPKEAVDLGGYQQNVR